jgi:hypothetical protein|tara:strand:+ start:757 stop:981 length:225 start_codon:yes stop_codon:yes gene_type:complete
MNNNIINRKLEEARAKIDSLRKKVNQEPKEPKQTVNTVPAGVQEHPPVNKGQNEQTIPGFITGGPKINKKMKEV